MKKIGYFLVILFVFVFSGCDSTIKEDSSFENQKSIQTFEVGNEPEEEIKRVVISAVGDCTLGTDTNFGAYSTFDTVLKDNNNDYTYFLKNVRHIFEKDDITIVNLEGPLTNGGERADKKYAFRGDESFVEILTSSSVEAVNLSNNHSKDYGLSGLADTKRVMDENGIFRTDGKESSIAEINGIKVGLISASLLDYSESSTFFKRLEALKQKEPDVIVASFHWGQELFEYPDENQIYFAHQAIDNGVDLVLGHHPHILQGIEKYKGKYIVYSLGNFCFGGNRNPVDKDTAIFRQVFSFYDGELDTDEVYVIPCSISSVKEYNNYQPTPLKDGELLRIKDKLEKLSSSFLGIENVMFTEK